LDNDYDLNEDIITINYINSVKLQRYAEDVLSINGGIIRETNNGKITFIPDAGFVGLVTFTYMINDRNFWINGQTDQATVTINVTSGVNSAPVAVDDTARTTPGAAVIIDPLANDTDSDGDALRISAVAIPAHGDVVDNPDGTLTYTPHAGFAGVDTFTYTVTDGNGGTGTATIAVNVTASNSPPAAADDIAGTTVDTPVIIDALANDTDSDGDLLSILAFGGAANGVVTANPGGTLTYVPHAGFAGTDQFTYSVTDGNGGTDNATVTVYVIPSDSGPLEYTFQNGVAGYSGVEDTYLRQASPNTNYGSAFSLNVDQSDGGGEVHGLVQFSGLFGSANGQIRSADIITSATLYLDVVNPGDALSLYEMLVPWSEAATWSSMTGGVQADGSEARATAAAVTAPVGLGTLAVDVTDSLTAWQANPGANFGWALLSNGTNGVDFESSETASGPRLVVQYGTGPAGNSAPAAADDTFDVDEGVLLTADLFADNGAGADSDPDGDPLTISSVNGAAVGDGQVVVLPSGAALTINSDGTFAYDQNGAFASLGHGASATDTFTYTVTDGNGGTGTAAVTVNVASSSPHNPGVPASDDHMAVLDLVKHSDVTHTAMSNGSWFDPATWAGNSVPGDDARVLIADGVVVDYDGVSNSRLMTVRVDGELHFSTTTDSKMVVDTFVVDTGGRLTAGTESNPVAGNVNIDIVIADNGDIDVAWDPRLISRGFISSGSVEIYGQEKTTHVKVATDPMAGETSLQLAEIPENWQIGDTIVLTGTQYDGYIWPNSPTRISQMTSRFTRHEGELISRSQ
jgi:VCBS repeat-containing protein